MIRSRKHRKWIASLPCAMCGKVNHSQAAHSYVFGRGIKASDKNVAPLCADSIEGAGCHRKYDQYDVRSNVRTLFKKLCLELHKVSGDDIKAFKLLREFRNELD